LGVVKKIRAFGLVSGGLDSILALLVLQEQGIKVTGLAFETPFFSADRAQKAMAEISAPLRVMDITDDHLAMLKEPRYGYGRNMNPCIDCHALMLKQAGIIMEEEGYDFLFTGEVLGQRPMSQTGSSLRLVSKLSGYDGYVLRPLSARLLPATIPEEEGKVDRERLLDIQGRNRKRQMAMAEKYMISSYSTPAGGCLLTDPGFSERLRDLFDAPRWWEVRDIELLKVGRHLRLSPDVKIVVGRNKRENEIIRELARPEDVLVNIKNIPGPLVLVPGGGDHESLKMASLVCASYSDAPVEEDVEVSLMTEERTSIIVTRSMERERLKSLMIGGRSRPKKNRHR